MIANLTNRIVVVVTMLYSVGIIVLSTPAGTASFNTLIIPYYLFIPGYNLSILLREQYGFLVRTMYSVFLGLTLLLSLSAIRQVNGLVLPFGIIVPVITMIIGAYTYLRPTTSIPAE